MRENTPTPEMIDRVLRPITQGVFRERGVQEEVWVVAETLPDVVVWSWRFTRGTGEPPILQLTYSFQYGAPLGWHVQETVWSWEAENIRTRVQVALANMLSEDRLKSMLAPPTRPAALQRVMKGFPWDEP